MKLSSVNFKNIITTIKFAFAIPIGLLARKFNKNVWIITERPDQARDNGYYFYKYLREQHPNEKVYYIIDKSSDDYKKIKEYGNIIKFNSFKHFVYYVMSPIHISAHVNGCCPFDSVSFCRRIKKYIKVKDVFLPHGVSYGISEFCLQKYAKINLYICSGKSEYENVLNNYGYTKNEVVYTGFPRLDGWHDINVNKKKIVLMPTWRAYIAQNPDTVFEETEYFKAYSSFIFNDQLQNFLIKNGLTLVFYLHNDMRKYVNSFKTDCEKIEIVYKDNQYDIQELLKESALLITDYSSVHFDFAYMNKPVLYFQFDKAEFFTKQYQSSVFDAEKNGFGKVAYCIDELISNLEEAYQNDFIMTEKYYNRMRDFYQIYDNHNCDRVYEEIKKIG